LSVAAAQYSNSSLTRQYFWPKKNVDV